MKIDKEFYLNNDVVKVAKNLLGKVLVTNFGSYTSGIIVEVEAYAGNTDKACHAYGGKKTKRTEIFYKEGGISYVYLCYGMHYLFNIITGDIKHPDAVLIRSIEPISGVDIMMKRRKLKTFSKKISSGPGVLTKALGINKTHNGISLMGDKIWVEDRKIKVKDILALKRIGVDYAKEDAKLPWRFVLKGNDFISKI
jgi:DNA-3-methyladenine glycosylase